MSEKQTEITDELSVETACKAIQHWRENKSDYPGSGIPDDIWRMMFSLEESGHDKKMLLRVLGMNAKQYKRKHKELISTGKSSTTTTDDKSSINPPPDAKLEFKDITAAMSEPPPFNAELSQEIKEAKAAVSKLKSTVDRPDDYLDRTTIIVECLDPHGFRLRIHMTSDSIEDVMQAFKKGGATIC